MAHSMIFPNVGTQTLSAVIHFVGTSVLAICLARRVAFEDLNTLRGWQNLTVARLSLILMFAFSLTFMMATGTLIHGIGLEDTATSCSLAIWSCILLYTTTKLLIYIFLSERVWLVWSNISSNKAALGASQGQNRHASTLPPTPTTSRAPSEWRDRVTKRLKNPVYLVCLISLLGYVAVIILLLVSRIAGFRNQDGSCVIGLARVGSIPLLTYDAYITVLLTTLFVWPLRTKKGMSDALRRLTTRTLIASFAALSTSAINITVLTVLRGHELGWVCLASCGTDVMLNALVLDFVTETRLKKIVKSRNDRVGGGAALAGASGSSVLTNGYVANAKVHFSAAAPPPRAPRASQMGRGPLSVTPHSGTTHSVDLSSEGEHADVKSRGLDEEIEIPHRNYKMTYPPPPTPMFPHTHDGIDDIEVSNLDHDIDIERDTVHRSASPPIRSHSTQPSIITPPARTPARLQRSRNNTGASLPLTLLPQHRRSFAQSDEGMDDNELDQVQSLPEIPSPWDPTTSFAHGASKHPFASPLQIPASAAPTKASGMRPWTANAATEVPSQKARNSSVPPPSAHAQLLSVRAAIRGFAENASTFGGNKTRPKKTLVVVTSKSETTIEAEGEDIA
ncbi:hypothetical protein DL93DRAFT_1754331 [Clavulina sp. PMI_390]|nr:hypothetical protein DL93DRAFT_1754331 [Clavulina sp. PMI_390]